MSEPTPRIASGALARYAVAWLAAGALVAAAAVLIIGAVTEDDVTLPPVKETELTSAARKSRCELRRVAAGETTRPPTDGPARGRSARPGVYDEPLRSDALVAAVRRGVVVIHHRADLEADLRDRLETIQEALPEGTIVAPDASGMPYELAVTAYRRLLGCRRVGDAAFDALRLFRGRYIGSGPDRASLKP